jgi:hypothetical protein
MSDPCEFDQVIYRLQQVQDELALIQEDKARANDILALACAALGLAQGGSIKNCEECPERSTCHPRNSSS